MLRPNPLLHTGRSGTAATSKSSQQTIPRTDALAVPSFGQTHSEAEGIRLSAVSLALTGYD